MDTHLSRRAFVGSSAAATLAAAVEPSPAVVKRHDEQVERLLQAQVTDPKSPWCGASPDEFGLYWPHSSARILEAFTTAFLAPQSKFYKNHLLMERMQLAAGFLTRGQTDRGNISLPLSNYDSPPDTGFVCRNAATSAALARKRNTPEVEKLTADFLRRAGGGMAVGGVHTPNHRWVICAALAQVNDLYPDPRFVRRIDQWLAEGIDITDDGFYSERSTLGYTPTVNNALVVAAAKLKRPALLDPVRRSLNATIYLLHPGNEVVTEISRRRDVNTRGDLARYWFPLRYLALHDKNGQYASLADLYPDAARLTEVMEFPELLEKGPERASVPDNYEKDFPTIGLTRLRRGETSANLLLRNSRFFSLRRGPAVINAVRFASSFFGKGQFVPQSIAKKPDGYHLRHSAEGPYYQPFDPPRQIGPTTDEWYRVREQRTKTEVSHLQQSAIVTESPNGFRIRVQSMGTTNMPVSVEINFREGGKLDGVVPAPRYNDAWLLKSGWGVYELQGQRIRFGPGVNAHGYTQVQDTEPKLPGPSVYLTGYTPFDQEIEFTWS